MEGPSKEEAAATRQAFHAWGDAVLEGGKIMDLDDC